MINHPPVLEAEFATLFANFCLGEKIAVAVSGGADSMALVLLISRWIARQSVPPALVALTVDHKLRSNSTTEAQTVANWLKLWGVEHYTLTWHHPPITTGLQQKAREARYDLLAKWCHNNNVTTLMTAHHLYDQWETFLMRLSRGSGLTGLCAIRSQIKTSFGTLVRPLLAINPLRLKSTLEFFNQPYLNDPSNDDNAFERIRWRKLLPVLSAEGLSPEAMQKALTQLQATEEFFEQQTDELFKLIVDDNCSFRLSDLQLKPRELVCRLLKKIISVVQEREILPRVYSQYQHIQPQKAQEEEWGVDYPACRQPNYAPNYATINRLYIKLTQYPFRGATAGGCVFKARKGGVIDVYLETRERKH